MKYAKYILENILSLKVRIALGSKIRYTLNGAHNTNYALYKSLDNNIICTIFSIIIYQNKNIKYIFIVR